MIKVMKVKVLFHQIMTMNISYDRPNDAAGNAKTGWWSSRKVKFRKAARTTLTFSSTMFREFESRQRPSSSKAARNSSLLGQRLNSDDR